MIEAFAAKFELCLKALSASRARLAVEMGVDKSIIGRWARGNVRPSADNLARLTKLVASRRPQFTLMDWERDIEGFALALGLDPIVAEGDGRGRLHSAFHDGLLEEAARATARRGVAFEGYFRSTRPYASQPGRFVHDHVMVRRGEDGLMRFDLRCDRVRVRGWLLPQHNQLFMIGAEDASGSAAFGIFNGATSARADVIDGLLLACALDATRTPTACAILFERIGELTADQAADDARLDELGAQDPLAPLGSVPEAVAAHLVRDFGPAALAVGGDWLLRLPLVRSAATGAGLDHGPGEYAGAFPSFHRPANETIRA